MDYGGAEAPFPVRLLPYFFGMRVKVSATHFLYRFWDWAEERVADEGLPAVLYKKTIPILPPGGRTEAMTVTVDIINPLAYFPIKDIPPDFTNETDDDVC